MIFLFYLLSENNIYSLHFYNTSKADSHRLGPIYKWRNWDSGSQQIMSMSHPYPFVIYYFCVHKLAFKLPVNVIFYLSSTSVRESTKYLIYRNGIPHDVAWIKGTTSRHKISTMNMPLAPISSTILCITHPEAAGLMKSVYFSS